MEKYYIGDVVRYLRKENKMTQEELADGICSPVTISRIENGSQMPSDRIINQILERLGSDVYQTTNIIRNKKVSPSSQNLSAVADLIQNGNITLASEQLSQINSTGFDNKQQQYLVLLQVSVILQSGSSYLSLVPDKIINALKLTKRNFSPDDFNDTLLTIREANLLNLLCVAYFRLNRKSEALNLAQKLSTNLLSHRENFKNNQELMLNVLLNLSQILEDCHCYDQALSSIKQAIDISLSSKYQVLFSELQVCRAKLLYKTGKHEEALSLFNILYPYLRLEKKDSLADFVQEYINKYF